MVILPLILLYLTLETEPLVVRSDRLSLDDMERIKKVLKENNPQHLQTGDVKRVSLTERDLNLIFSHTLTYFPHNERISGNVSFELQSVRGRLTTLLPKNPFGTFLNTTAELSIGPNSIRIQDVHIGALDVPDWLVNKIGKYCHKVLSRRDDYRDLIESLRNVKRFKLNKNELVLVYEWDPAIANRLQSRGRNLLFPDDEKERLLVYQRELTMALDEQKGRQVSLTKLLRPLASLACDRSGMGNPVAENHSLLFVVAVYVMNGNLMNLIGANQAKNNPIPRRLHITLSRRRDLAQHFIASAIIAASANSNTANVIGLFKEIDDSRGGSGFSFADLTADRAGVKFGELAIGSPASAKFLQEQLKENLMESHFMPSIKNLPEGIMEFQFKKTYGDLDSEAFRLVNKEIEHRLSICTLFRKSPLVDEILRDE